MTIKALYPNIDPSLSLDFANTKALDPRITFARASTARFYDGKTVSKAEENLLIRSQEFDDAYWTKDAATVTANSTTAPDGTTTADTMTLPGNTGDIGPLVSALNTANTFACSLFVKYVNTQWFRLALFNSNITANFFVDVQNGVAGTAQNGTLTVTNAGNGWYRIQAVATLPSGSNGRVFFHPNNGDGTVSRLAGSVFIWGAQLEQRSAVTAYTPTTTQPITNYVPVLQSAANNVARFDHNPVTNESLGLLIEEQRTNLVLRSEEFTTTWTLDAVGVTINTIVAPSGELTGELVQENTANTTHSIFQSTTTVASTTYTLTVYAKLAQGARSLRLSLNSAASTTLWAAATYDLATGTVSSSNAAGGGTVTSTSITNVGNGWYRCALIGNIGANTDMRVLVATATNNDYTASGRGRQVYTGDGYSGVYIWGAQLEAGAFPTSYIPTVASQVTRSADAASMTGANFSSWYRADEGSFYVESMPSNIAQLPYNFTALSDPANFIQSFAASALHFRVSTSAGIGVDIDAGTYTDGAFSKLAAGYKFNDFAAVLDGGAVGTDTSGSVPVVSAFYIGSNGSTIRSVTIKKIAFYPKRLANAELQALTT